ncbi:hypothetical protein GCM10010129_38900 [Streptomyces fumigatiscleroticus]|nr:hypothetical protein GCM10010129_38900 [Streptomyces fumigatiscleroticus]
MLGRPGGPGTPACGLDPVDRQVAESGHPDGDRPHVPGPDVAGAADAAGEGVTGVRPGQRAVHHADLRRRGGLDEYALADATAPAPVPDALDAATAGDARARAGPSTMLAQPAGRHVRGKLVRTGRRPVRPSVSCLR